MTIDIPRQIALWQEAFDDPQAVIDRFLHTGFSPDHCHTVCQAGEVVAALYWFDVYYREQKMAYLYAVATAKKHRGKGYCRQLLTQTHAMLKNQGYQAALLVPEKGLAGMYEKFGYRFCTKADTICCAPEESALELKPLNGQVYTNLRREYLPADGVLQPSCLAFLESSLELYWGDDFLLAVSVEEGVARGELLGNRGKAPAITAALGASQGRFRTPGSGEDLAMICPLCDDVQVPGYFGIVYD